MPRPRPLAILSVAILAGPACAWVSDAERYPAPEDRLEIVTTTPAAGATAVDPTARIDLCLSGLADPASLGDLDATLSSGSVVFDIDLDLQLFAWRPPLGAAATDRPWCPGSVVSLRPRAPLRSGTRYRVRLRPTLHGWGGEPLDVSTPGWQGDDDPIFDLEFMVAPTAPGGAEEADPPPPPRTLRDLFADGGPFDPARGLCSCHREPYGLARERLALNTPDAAFLALVVDDTPRSTGYPRIAAHRPSESFLIHKLLRDDEGEPLHGVRGAAMPLPGAIPYPDLAAIARWIEDGALY